MQAGNCEDMGDAILLIEGSDILIHGRFISRQQCAVNAGVLWRQQLIEDRSHPKSKRLQPSCKGLRIPSDDSEGGPVHRTMYGYRPIVQTKIKHPLIPRRFHRRDFPIHFDPLPRQRPRRLRMTIWRRIPVLFFGR